MLNTYLAIVSHPLFFTFIALCGGIYALLWATSLKPSALPQPLVWLRRHYVSALLIVVGVLFVLAMTFYLVEIGLGVRRLVDLLGNELAKAEPQAEALRFLAHSIGILVAILAGSATIFFASIRVWTNERNTTATEQGLITDRINKAVEGLGAEKTVKQQRQGSEGALLYEDDANGEPDLKKPIMAEITKPNIEVRIGSILALERLAKENLDFHIQIMEILCAYVRNNAPCDDPSPTGNLESVPVPRDDIQIAIKCLGRRRKSGKQTEASLSFRLNLRGCDLTRVDFREQDFSGAIFHHSHFKEAIFRDTQLRGSDFSFCNIKDTIIFKCDLTGSKFCNVKTTARDHSQFPISIQSNTLRGMNLAGAKVADLEYLPEAEVLQTTFGTKNTILKDSLARLITALLEESAEAGKTDDGTAQFAIMEKLVSMGVENWSHHDSGELPAAKAYNDLMIKLDLCHFPFHGRHK
ncbi:pentapeptide repeat-containing protein [Phaeobacter inhibens]|uniref:pentapeptide repeat-containing protein n=1 Tax=Phaeobacter inhibens TaxID=221822 RepID=UPI0021A9298F|nr:pentapeptide repeat-containing protein [Phaeobacter inhibens]UWR90867.1 pentapeptide repeat-containing protein [Phaeobacter inhibens]